MTHTTNNGKFEQDSCAVAGKPRDAVVIFQDVGRLSHWMNQK